MPATPAPITTGTIEANGIEFSYRSAGEGPLALCLHGFPDSAYTWDLLLPELAAAGYRAVAPFLRGYAPTAIPADGAFQMGAIATDATALHEVLEGDGDAVLIGHDWGALASYSTISHEPDRWARLVTGAVPPPAAMAAGYFTYDQLQKSWYMFFFQTPFAEIAVPMDDLAFIDRLWSDWSPGLEDRTWASHAKDAMRDPANLAAAIGYYRATIGNGLRTPEYDLVELTSGSPIAQPHLYIHGRDDGCMGVSMVESHQAERAGEEGFTVEIIDDAGHFFHLEQPEQVNRLIIDFVTA